MLSETLICRIIAVNYSAQTERKLELAKIGIGRSNFKTIRNQNQPRKLHQCISVTN